LDRAGGAGIRRRDESVRKRKQSLAGDVGPFEIEPGLAGLPDRDARTVDPRHLTRANAERALAMTVDDGVRLHVLRHLPAEHHAGPLLGRRLALRDDLEISAVAELTIAILQKNATDHGAHFLQGRRADAPGRDHQAQVLLLFEDLQRLIAVARGDDDLGEYLGNGASQVRTERVIDDDDAA